MEAVLVKHFSFLPKGPLLAENIKGSSVEINVNELSLPCEITQKLGHFTRDFGVITNN